MTEWKYPRDLLVCHSVSVTAVRRTQSGVNREYFLYRSPLHCQSVQEAWSQPSSANQWNEPNERTSVSLSCAQRYWVSSACDVSVPVPVSVWFTLSVVGQDSPVRQMRDKTSGLWLNAEVEPYVQEKKHYFTACVCGFSGPLHWLCVCVWRCDYHHEKSKRDCTDSHTSNVWGLFSPRNALLYSQIL